MSTGAISISSERQKSIDFSATVLELVPGIATPRTNTGKGSCINDVDKVLCTDFTQPISTLYLTRENAYIFYGGTPIKLAWSTEIKLFNLPPVTLNMLIYMDVFMSNLWFGVIGGMAFVAMCYFAINRFGRARLYSDSESHSLLNSLAVVMIMCMQRDYKINKNGLSTRLEQ